MQRFGSHSGKHFTGIAGSGRRYPLALAATLALAGGVAHARPPLTFDLVGTATRIEHSVQLSPPEGGQGAAWRQQAISLTQSFKVKFKFSLHGSSFPQADGIAFVIQTDGTAALGTGGGCLGYCGINGVASVVQTYTNDHVGFTLDGNPSDAPPSPIDLGYTQRIEGEEEVSYDAVNHVLTMQGQLNVDGSVVPIGDRANVDLASLLASDTATIGFTAGTGDNHADQRILDFNFHYTP